MASKRRPQPARPSAMMGSSNRGSKGKSATAPGRMFKAMGLGNASSIAPGYSIAQSSSTARRTR